MTTYLAEKQDVINWFLSKENMSSKRLQCLLYYAHAWAITLFNEAESDIDIKLASGIEFTPGICFPIDKEVSKKYRETYAQILQYKGDLADFDEDTCDLLNDVWSVYGGFNDLELSILIKQESPYQKARRGAQDLDLVTTKIKDEDMFACYHARVDQSNE